MQAQALIKTPVGQIAVRNTNDALTGIELLADKTPFKINAANALTKLIVSQLNDYFDGKLIQFDLPLEHHGTEFQNKVWRQLTQIHYGDVLQYGEFAKIIDTSPRAIGGACRHNPIPIIIPCHRVIAATGIGGYSGQWRFGHKVDIKQWLLKHETSHLNPLQT